MVSITCAECDVGALRIIGPLPLPMPTFEGPSTAKELKTPEDEDEDEDEDVAEGSAPVGPPLPAFDEL